MSPLAWVLVGIIGTHLFWALFFWGWYFWLTRTDRLNESVAEDFLAVRDSIRRKGVIK